MKTSVKEPKVSATKEQAEELAKDPLLNQTVIDD